MTSFITHTTVDCRNAYELSEWWKQVLGHVDLGATQVADHRDHHGPGIGWVVLQDPEGNEFCILRSEEERAANPMQPQP